MAFLNHAGLERLWAHITLGLSKKVDKVQGMGLSTNNYTTIEKNKLSGIDEGANKTIVDSSMSTSSTNPLQNKVVTAAINELDTLIGDQSVATQISTAISDVTPASIGAVKKAGDTMTGTLTINSTASNGYVSLVNDAEGGTIKIGSKNGTYVYEVDAYNDESIRIHTAVKRPADVEFKSLTWNAKTGKLSAGSLGLSEALSVGAGGTGATTAKGAEYAISGGMEESAYDVASENQFVFKKTAPSSTAGVFVYKTAATVWDWIATRIRNVFGFSSDNVLPRSNGGTGASTLNGAQKNLFTTQSISETTDILALTNGFYHFEGDASKNYNWPVAKQNHRFEVMVQGNRNPNGGYWYVMVMDMYDGTIYYNHYYWSSWKGWKKITSTAV